MLRLDNRLQAAADLIGHCEIFYDVGANHGRLGLYMLQNGLCNRVVLTDISEKSLVRAGQLIDKLGIGDHIQTRVADGLTGLPLTAKDAVAVCGMGARTILSILQTAALPCPAVLQANTEVEKLTEALPDLRLHLIEEKRVIAARRHYTLLLVEPEA